MNQSIYIIKRSALIGVQEVDLLFWVADAIGIDPKKLFITLCGCTRHSIPVSHMSIAEKLHVITVINLHIAPIYAGSDFETPWKATDEYKHWERLYPETVAPWVVVLADPAVGERLIVYHATPAAMAAGLNEIGELQNHPERFIAVRRITEMGVPI